MLKFTIITLVCSILGLWYYFGFVYAPKLPLAERGIFGDSFGSVNALFSGLAICGLVITVIIQIGINKNQKQQENLALALRLYDDIKDDFARFEFDNLTGLEAVNAFRICIKQDDNRIFKGAIDHSLTHMYTTIDDMAFLIDYLSKPIISDDVRMLLFRKTLKLYKRFLTKLEAQVEVNDNERLPYKQLKLSFEKLSVLMDLIEKNLRRTGYDL